jgi:hypothetical protein
VQEFSELNFYTMASKTEQLDQLFDEWEQSVDDYKGKFVRDGIIDELLYLTTTPKILFITKEPNNPEQKAGDFREWWRKEIAYTFSYRLAEWSYGLIGQPKHFNSLQRLKMAPGQGYFIAFGIVLILFGR